MSISDDDVIDELTASGARVEDYFLIGHDICCFDRSNRQVILLLIEEVEGDDGEEIHNAILGFLRRRGAKSYDSHEDFANQNNND